MTLIFTDGWHPTVNPSARMPIHHFRFRELLGSAKGILAEFPRQWGGTTLRLLRFNNGVVWTREIPPTLRWSPWWLPASVKWAQDTLSIIYETAVRSDLTTPEERSVCSRVLEEFRARCQTVGGVQTIGEALHYVMDSLHREIVPDLPTIELLSFTRHPMRAPVAEALRAIPGGFVAMASRWAKASGDAIWPLFAVGTRDDGTPIRIRLHAESRTLDTGPLTCDVAHPIKGSARVIDGEELATLLESGRLVPSSRMVALAEAQLRRHGVPVLHFGNTYGRIAEAARLLDPASTDDVSCCPDNEDSWHYAQLVKEPINYPLHLLEVAACRPAARAVIPALVREALAFREPVILQPSRNLDETLLNRRT